MSTDALPPVAATLARLAIPYRLFTHPGPVTSLEQAAYERGQRPAQVVRSILFRLAQDRFAMVLVAGPAQVDWKRLRQQIGQSRLTMASAEEVLAVTGYPIGAVSPLGLPQPLPVYIDESVLAEAEISLGSGVRGTTVILASAALLAALPGAEVGLFRQAEASASTG
jgi:Cys-tRNA(Pro) deacylase